MSNTFEEFNRSILSTAEFLNDPDPHKVIREGFAEEYVELLSPDNEIADPFERALWGRTVDPGVYSQLRRHVLGEAGDNIYYMAAANYLCGFTPIPMLQRAAEILGGEGAAVDDIEQLDELAGMHRLGKMPPDAKPDYFALQFWNVPPYEQGTFSAHPAFPDSDAAGPIQFSPNGKHVLASTLGWTLEVIGGRLEDQEEYVNTAGLALAAIAVVARDRFNVTMTEIFDHNAAKRERRKAANTIRSGDDPERSSPRDDTRNHLSNSEARLIGFLS